MKVPASRRGFAKRRRASLTACGRADMGGLVRGLYLRADAALCQLLAPFVGRPGWRSAHLQPLATDAGPTDTRTSATARPQALAPQAMHS